LINSKRGYAVVGVRRDHGASVRRDHVSAAIMVPKPHAAPRDSVRQGVVTAGIIETKETTQ
jgi:hypothetical protein